MYRKFLIALPELILAHCISLSPVIDFSQSVIGFFDSSWHHIIVQVEEIGNPTLPMRDF
jgi:hypothetical protein